VQGCRCGDADILSPTDPPRDVSQSHHFLSWEYVELKKWMVGQKTPDSAGCFWLDEEAPFGCEPEHYLAARLSSVEVALGEENTDAGPDAALAVSGMQHVHNIGDVATLFFRDCLKYRDMRRGRFKDFGSLIGDFLHSFHNSSW
jgi:hypothetical protein